MRKTISGGRSVFFFFFIMHFKKKMEMSRKPSKYSHMNKVKTPRINLTFPDLSRPFEATSNGACDSHSCHKKMICLSLINSVVVSIRTLMAFFLRYTQNFTLRGRSNGRVRRLGQLTSYCSCQSLP